LPAGPCGYIRKHADIGTEKDKKETWSPCVWSHPVTAIRLPEDLSVRVEDWAAKQRDTPSRSEAIRRLVEIGLAGVRPRPRLFRADAVHA
jgi:hypothetical protein